MKGIKLKNICKSFGSVAAVRDVSLEIKSGEFFFLLGPSGCGKTTLLRMLAGFEQPDNGSILFDDKEMMNVPPNRRNTGMVFQNYALWPHLSVRKNVEYGLTERLVAKPEREDRVMAVLDIVKMRDYADRMPGQLSGGQQQRVALARALVIQPDVVLMDEPLSNLDARLRSEMRYELKRIHAATGVTMVYVTHDQREALSMADNMAVMSMGKVEQTGRPRDVYRSPANVFVAGFVGETNVFEGEVREITETTVRVATGLGDILSCTLDSWLRVGAKVCCIVRPESVSRVKTDGNSLKCRVEESLYHGETEELVLAVGANKIRMVFQNPRQAAPEKGSEIEVFFSAEDVIVLPG